MYFFTEGKAMRRKNVNMLSGSITKGLLAMTMPIMIMNVIQSLFNIIDMTALKYFSDDSAVGAVGASAMLITLCTSLLIGISAGANVVVAKRLGQGNKELVDKAAMTAVLLAVVGGIILMIIGVGGGEAFLKMTNCPESLLSKAVLYFRIYFFGVPLLMLYNFCAAILRATGDTKKPMYFVVFGGAVKVFISVTFICVFDMDVEGVGFATVISWAVMCALALGALLKNKDVHIDFKKIGFYASELKEMLFIGIPSGLQTGMYSLANVVITTAVNSFGADATTGIAIANQFDGLMYQIIYAPALATVPYVAQNIGAGNIERVKKTVLRSALITTAFGVTFGSLSAIFSGQLSSIMSETPAVIKYSQQKMIIVSSTYFLSGINEIMGGVLKGMRKPIIPTAATLVYMCLFRFVWVYGIFPYCPNLTFLYLVWPIGWVSSIITLLFAYFPAISKLQQEILNNRSIENRIVVS